MLDALERFTEAGHSWLIECLALVAGPFLHEDVAILGASLLVVEHQLPLVLALASLFAGMVSSDLALYSLGVLARRSPRVRRALLSPRIERLGHWLGDHVPETVVLARFVPGLMFPLYVGCGLYRVSFVRFALTTTVTAAVYLPVVFLLFATFGAAILSDLGYWSWLVAIGLLVIVAFNWTRNPSWRLLLRVSTAGAGALVRRVGALLELSGRVTHQGMPALGELPRMVSRAERIPAPLFYIPLGIQWLWLGLRHRDLSLPALANPRIEVGGLWGESKNSYLAMVGEDERRWLADFITIRRGRGPGSAVVDCDLAMTAMATTGLSFPVVTKPDIGWRGYGVRLIQDRMELADYLAAFPEGETLLLQRPVPCDGEAGVLYARLPGEPDGRILSLTLRYFPYVVGDGQSRLRDLILRDQRAAWKAGTHFGLDSKHMGKGQRDLDRVPAMGETVRLSFVGTNRVGGLYRDAREHITAALARRFDAISKSMPEFYYGRYDVRFESLERLSAGEGFRIIEINGAGGESINVWDPLMSFAQVYRELFHQQSLLFEIGARNRARGYHSPGIWAVLRSQWRQYRLIKRYPPSS
ncbi:MAG: VTT domain-containing protein [Alphaproteobacteria bacterium]